MDRRTGYLVVRERGSGEFDLTVGGLAVSWLFG